MGSQQGDDLQLNGDMACENATIRGNLTVGGVVDNGQPAQAPFPPVPLDIAISVATTGSDTTGDGTVAKPYRTGQRAIRDVPLQIPSGQHFLIEALDEMGDEFFPTQYIFPTFVATGANGGEIDFSQATFHYRAPVMIRGKLRQATGVTGITTIPFVGSVVSVPDPGNGLIAIQFVGAGWTPGQLIGKYALGAGTAVQHSVIKDNTIDTIFLERTSAPTFPVRIQESTWRWVGDRDPNVIHLGAININNTPIMLQGIEVVSQGLIPGPFPFPRWGLQLGGNAPPAGAQLCTLPGLGITTTDWGRIRQCYVPEPCFMTGQIVIIQCLLRGSLEVFPFGPRLTMWNMRGPDNLIRQSSLVGMVTMQFRDVFDLFLGQPVGGGLHLDHVEFLDPIQLAFPPGTPVYDDAMVWEGGWLRANHVTFNRTAPGPGSAIRAHGGTIILQSVTGANWADYGVLAENNTQVLQDDGGGVATNVAGALGAFKAGSLAAEPAWPAVVYPAVGSNFIDTGVATGQLTRVARQS